MASNGSGKHEGNGAAEEPAPERDASLPPSSTASYDPTVFQRPHPDDRKKMISLVRLVRLVICSSPCPAGHQ